MIICRHQVDVCRIVLILMIFCEYRPVLRLKNPVWTVLRSRTEVLDLKMSLCRSGRDRRGNGWRGRRGRDTRPSWRLT